MKFKTALGATALSALVCYAQVPPANEAVSQGSPAATAPGSTASEISNSDPIMIRTGGCMSQRYPIAAKKAKHEGNGILEITISADGGLGSALVKKSTGYPELDQAMLDSVKPCKFKHGSGDPAKAYDMPMRFRLEPN